MNLPERLAADLLRLATSALRALAALIRLLSPRRRP